MNYNYQDRDLIYPEEVDNTKVDKAKVTVTNSNIRENEEIVFTRNSDDYMEATVPTVPINKSWHWDVIILIVLFAVTMFISQKIMMAIRT